MSDAAKSVPGRALASSAAVEAAGAEGERWRPFAELELRGRAQPTLAYQPEG